jgi:NADH-quinone oxidoreductase subunit L
VKATFELLWLIPFLPLLGALLNGALSLGGARSAYGPSRGFVSLIAVLMPALSFLITVLATVTLVGMPSPGVNNALEQPLWDWFAINTGGFVFTLKAGLVFDRLTSMMLLFVTGIGTLIHLYSVGYMWEDRGFARFMSYLNLFMFSMIVLVIGDSLPMTFLGWEGVGLCSYLLIGFWHTNTEYNDAARKAFIVNRIGDLGFLLGAFMLFQVMSSNGQGSLDYREIAKWFSSAANAELISANGALLGGACLLIFLGCTGKSAQIPLVTWLPDAMAGPTPVSALIHAATMVTSGVYLLARMSDVFVHATHPVLFGLTVMQVILIVGCLTAAWGAIAGLVQLDIKKALAYSTVSQLGFMFMACGVGAFDVALFHVFTHAFFKATLFLGAGSVIHGMHHEQDMRRMGGLDKLMPVTYVWMWCGWFAIIGLPMGSGFFSKDLILERLLDGPGFAPLIGGVALAVALITAIYMTRMMYLVFWSPARHSDEVKGHVHESPATMLVPVSILGFGSLMVGVLWSPMLEEFKAGTHIFEAFLRPVLGDAQHFIKSAEALHAEGAEAMAAAAGAAHHVNWLYPILGTMAALGGLLIARFIWLRGQVNTSEKDLTGFAAAWTWGFDRVYHAAVIIPTKIVAWILAWVVDAALAGIVGLSADISRFMADGYASIQRPRLRSSLALSVAGAAALVALLLLSGPIAWAVGLTAAAVAVIYLLLEFLF